MSLLDYPSVPTQRRSPEDTWRDRIPAVPDQPDTDRPRPRRPERPCHPGTEFPVAPHLPPGAAVLLDQAAEHLATAERCETGAERYVAAHLAALRAATAVVVARQSPRKDERVASVWRLLVGAAPELRWWAEFFAAGTDRRVVAEFGGSTVPLAEADGLLARVGEFITIAHRAVSGVAR